MKATQQTIDKFRKTILDNTSEEHREKLDNWISEEDKPNISLEDVMVAFSNIKIAVLVDEWGYFRDDNGDYYDAHFNWKLTLPSNLQEEQTLLSIIKLFE